MSSFSAWLITFRLRTLPLSLSTIILGSFLAAFQGSFRWPVFIWAVLTTLFLQILSNLANDYGDAVHGVDNHERTGPKRSLQAGAVTMKGMRHAILIFILLALFSGIVLLIEGMKGMTTSAVILMFLIGLAAIGAALKYTMGKKPYGYAGFGDLFVFLFFGLVGVVGSCFLHTHQLTFREFLPAISIGLFSTGVLNLNNMRDRDNDAAHKKKTLVVKLGIGAAKRYHAALLIVGMSTAVLYSLTTRTSAWQWIYLLSFPLFVRSMAVVFKTKQLEKLDPELKFLSLSTLLFTLLFGVGLLV